MTERSPAERPTACPFLAFEEDRDFRADRPDHRHRCFAETRPAARAISHQELFCLGGAFAECTTFTAWAAREAAAVRRPTVREPEASRLSTGASSVGRAAPAAGGVGAAGRAASTTGAVGAAGAGAAESDWLAPPSWAAGERSTAPASPEDVDQGPDLGWDDGPAEPVPGARAPSPRVEAASEPSDLGDTPPFLAGRDRPPTSAPVPGPSDRTAPQPVSGRASTPPPSGYTSSAARAAAQRPDSLWIQPDSLEPAGDEQWEDAVEAAAAARVARARLDDERAGRSSGSRFGLGRSRPPTAGQARPLPERAADPSAPAWERPRRFEAYPAIKSTRRSPHIPRVAIWAGLLLAAALVLFLVPPFFLGGGDGGSSASPTPKASAGASTRPSPTATPVPEPTPFRYKVKSGDTLSGIAAKYKVSVEDILAVNPDLKDPNRLQIGYVLVIPLPVSSVIPDAGTPKASAAP